MAVTKLPTVDNIVLTNVVAKVTPVFAKVLTSVITPVIAVDRIPESKLKIPEVNPPATPAKAAMIVPTRATTVVSVVTAVFSKVSTGVSTEAASVPIAPKLLSLVVNDVIKEVRVVCNVVKIGVIRLVARVGKVVSKLVTIGRIEETTDNNEVAKPLTSVLRESMILETGPFIRYDRKYYNLIELLSYLIYP